MSTGNKLFLKALSSIFLFSLVAMFCFALGYQEIYERDQSAFFFRQDIPERKPELEDFIYLSVSQWVFFSESDFIPSSPAAHIVAAAEMVLGIFAFGILISAATRIPKTL